MITVNNIARDKALNDIDSLATIDERVEALADLDEVDKERLFNIVQLAIKNVFARTILNKESFDMPGLGKIKIKKYNKIAIRCKNGVAKEMGYDNFRAVPKDKREEMNNRAHDLIILEIRENKKEENLKREIKIEAIRHKPKIFTFKLDK